MENFDEEKSLRQLISVIEHGIEAVTTLKDNREKSLKAATTICNNLSVEEGRLRQLEETVTFYKEWRLLLSQFTQPLSCVLASEQILDATMRPACQLLLRQLIARSKNLNNIPRLPAPIPAPRRTSRDRIDPCLQSKVNPVDTLCLEKIRDIEKLLDRAKKIEYEQSYKFIEPPLGSVRILEMHAFLTDRLEKNIRENPTSNYSVLF